jgi:hypothetical protein
MKLPPLILRYTDKRCRSPHFDLNKLETVRQRITQLREAQSIRASPRIVTWLWTNTCLAPPPLQVGPLVRFEPFSAPEIGPVSFTFIPLPIITYQ